MFAPRKRRLSRALRAAGLDSLLVTHLPDVRYLTGFTGSNAAVLVQGTRLTLFTDGRYTTQAADEVVGAKVAVVPGSAASAALLQAVQAGATRCGFDPGATSVATLDLLRAALPGKQRRSLLVPAPALLADLRAIKDEVEQDAMRAAADLGSRLFDQVLEHIVPGATEMEVAMALEFMARLAGAEAMSFETIVAAGVRSALPHGRATLNKIPRRGFVTLDFGVVLEGYCSDMTRTVHMGPARRASQGQPGEREVYDAVLEAQEAGVAAVRAGVAAGEVDRAAREVLERAGLADSFTHSTGHGVGLEVHEMPRLAKAQTTPLRAGMTVTIEPGVYLPGRFGVRIEDTVLVTATGANNLSAATRAWIEL